MLLSDFNHKVEKIRYEKKGESKQSIESKEGKKNTSAHHHCHHKKEEKVYGEKQNGEKKGIGICQTYDSQVKKAFSNKRRSFRKIERHVNELGIHERTSQQIMRVIMKLISQLCNV